MQNLECLPRKTLKQYVTGWTEPGESAAIEEHLKSCELCEQTIEDLERDPDTLMEFVRSSNPPESSSEQRDAVADYALSRAKELVAPAAEMNADMNGEMSAADVALAPMPAPDIGPYELLQPLGHGGMGAVYLARHRQLGKQVAIKLLPARAFRNDHYAARFQREIRAAGSLNHPAIINATDAGQHGSTHYLVMEYIDGLDVSRIARATGRLSVADACAIMRAVALGLSHAHAAGVVHRDIKPSNLMISRGGQVKILDFGLAQITLWDEASAELTTVGQLMGTIDYMAPEQAERADLVDYRADLYSMGATLFRMLCGRAPLAATPNLSPLAKLRLLATSESPNLSTLREDAPPALSQLVHSLLARDPAHRPASAAHVAEQLAEFVAEADLPTLVASALASQDSATEHLSTTSGSVDPLLFRTKVKPASGFAGRSRRWLTMAALVPIFILAGVLITLETQKGQLIIESVDANVDVSLFKNGRRYETVSVVPGVNTTRIYAGTYEVVIDSGSDRFELDGDRIDVKRGETVIAKLRRVPSNQKIAQTEATQQSTVQPAATGAVGTKSDEIVYNRQPLPFWLEQFARERSPTAINEALAAIAALANSSNVQQITQPILSALPQLDLQHDEDAFTLILKAQGSGPKYIDQLVLSLESGDERWAGRVLTNGVRIYMQRSTVGAEQTGTLLPLISWVEENGFQADSGEMLWPAAQFFTNQVNRGSLERALEDKLIDRLVSSPRLGGDYWLAALPSAWNPRYASAVESKAVELFIDEQSPSRDVARAAMLLTVLSGPKYNRAGMEPLPNSDKLRSTLAFRLHQFIEKPDSLHEIVPVPGGFHPEATPTPHLPTPFGIQTSINHFDSSACLIAVELLDLVEALGECDPCLEQVRAIHQALLPAVTDFAVTLFGNPSKGILHNHITFSWPSLSINVSGASGRLHVEPQALLATLIFTRAESTLPKDERPTPKERDRLLMTRWIEVRIRELDTNRDGQLSTKEAQPEFSDPGKIDADQNGMISAEEISEAYENKNR